MSLCEVDLHFFYLCENFVHFIIWDIGLTVIIWISFWQFGHFLKMLIHFLMKILHSLWVSCLNIFNLFLESINLLFGLLYISLSVDKFLIKFMEFTLQSTL